MATNYEGQHKENKLCVVGQLQKNVAPKPQQKQVKEAQPKTQNRIKFLMGQTVEEFFASDGIEDFEHVSVC